ncbi:unnamed protein product [Polarella glacialis]|uniref:Cyclic nucleotide-binding domain-containing protein n=1 Tax=Polarella glacialis TaxID=89957 RepID=A0A813J1Z7_POLGL|nr:unnamed protein product [Polarella glacialis]
MVGLGCVMVFVGRGMLVTCVAMIADSAELSIYPRSGSTLSELYGSLAAGDVRQKSIRHSTTSAMGSGTPWEEAQRAAERKRRSPPWVLSPASSARLIWDLFGMMLLSYDIIWIPMRVFQPPEYLFTTVLDMLVSGYWTLDIVLNFFTGYYLPSKEIVMTRRKIAWQYLTHWLLLDVIIVSFDWVDLVTFLINQSQAQSKDIDGASLARIGKVVRVARIFRTIRLLRLAKMKKVLLQIQEKIDSEPIFIVIGTFQNLIALIIVNHVFACFWFFIGADAGWRNNWVDFYGAREMDFWERYVLSMHWSLTQFTPATMHVGPINVLERSFNILLILIAMVGFSSFVSAITASMTRLRTLQSSGLNNAFLLRRYLKENRISTDLQARVIRYIDLAVEMHKGKTARSRVTNLELLSGPLHVALQKELYLPHLVRHDFFAHYQYGTSAMNELCFRAITSMSLSKADILFSLDTDSHDMYFLANGNMFYQRPRGFSWEAKSKAPEGAPAAFRRILIVKKGDYMCEAPLWVSWSHRGTMGALIESELLLLSAEKFRLITLEHKSIFHSSKRYANNYLKMLRETVETKGCMFDLPREVTFPQTYPPVISENIYYSPGLEAQEEVRKGELLEAVLDPETESESEGEEQAEMDEETEFVCTEAAFASGVDAPPVDSGMQQQASEVSIRSPQSPNATYL